MASYPENPRVVSPEELAIADAAGLQLVGRRSANASGGKPFELLTFLHHV